MRLKGILGPGSLACLQPGTGAQMWTWGHLREPRLSGEEEAISWCPWKMLPVLSADKGHYTRASSEPWGAQYRNRMPPPSSHHPL